MGFELRVLIVLLEEIASERSHTVNQNHNACIEKLHNHYFVELSLILFDHRRLFLILA